MEMLIFLALMGGVFYFLLIRPQRKRQAEHRSLLEELSPGDDVITIGGMYGRILEIGEIDIILGVEGGSKIKMLKSSIMGRQQVDSIDEVEVMDDDDDEGDENKTVD